MLATGRTIVIDLEEYFTVFSVKYSFKSMTFESKAFNELLALGYFESSTISVSHLPENILTV